MKSICIAALVLVSASNLMSQNTTRPRAREVGIVVGNIATGPNNAITDVAGVKVGQVTVVEGDSVRTGVTAILQHPGNVFLERVPAAIHIANAYGKLVGSTQVQELGELETPILLTCTLCVWRAADAMVEWMLKQPGLENVRSINPVVGETNDGGLNNIRARPVRAEHVVRALESAATGPVAEGSVGAGTGTVAFGYKGGIGTSSRVMPFGPAASYTVGVLVQSNYGGDLRINGAPVGRTLRARGTESQRRGDGSIMMIVATDAPLDSRNLERLAARAVTGLARTGSSMSNGSGDFVIAFSTATSVRRRMTDNAARTVTELPNDLMSGLFRAVADATEEAVYNSMFKATTVKSATGTVEALPVEAVVEILRKHGVIQ